MSNKNTAKNLSETTGTNGQGDEGFMMSAPKGARKVVTRSNGFWDENHGAPVYGRIMFAREVTPTRGPSKGKVKRYYVVELAADTMIAERKDKDEPARRAKKGEMIAIWGSPGLNDLNLMAGALIWVKKNPESEFIDTGKGNKMKTFDIQAEGKGEKVRVLAFDQTDEDEQREVSSSPLPF